MIPARAKKSKYPVRLEVRHSDPRQGATITITDLMSGLVLLEVEMTWADFAEAVLTNIYGKEGTATVWSSPNHGRVHQNKSVVLVDAAAQLRAELSEFKRLIDFFFHHDFPKEWEAGWRPFNAGSYNHHNRTGTGYRIGIERYVDPAEVEA